MLVLPLASRLLSSLNLLTFIIDTGSNKHLSAVTCLQFHGKFVITSSDDGTVKLWDVGTGKVPARSYLIFFS